jgi:hypothetical protein
MERETLEDLRKGNLMKYRMNPKETHGILILILINYLPTNDFCVIIQCSKFDVNTQAYIPYFLQSYKQRTLLAVFTLPVQDHKSFIALRWTLLHSKIHMPSYSSVPVALFGSLFIIIYYVHSRITNR